MRGNLIQAYQLSSTSIEGYSFINSHHIKLNPNLSAHMKIQAIESCIRLLDRSSQFEEENSWEESIENTQEMDDIKWVGTINYWQRQTPPQHNCPIRLRSPLEAKLLMLVLGECIEFSDYELIWIYMHCRDLKKEPLTRHFSPEVTIVEGGPIDIKDVNWSSYDTLIALVH